MDEDDWSISQRAAFHALRLRKEAQSPLVAGTVFGPHCGIICGGLCAGIDQITEALDRILTDETVVSTSPSLSVRPLT